MNNNTIKILLTINLEGGALIRQCEETITLDGQNHLKPLLKKKTVKHVPLVQKPCYQQIKLNKEAYEFMTSKDGVLSRFNSYIWATMSKKKRLEEHLKEYCSDLKGTSYSYELLDD